MDIRKWLDEVAATHSPQSLPAKPRAKPAIKKCARKRDGSGSSLLPLQSQSPLQRPLSAEPKASVEPSVSKSADSEASQFVPNGSSRRYARRSRRKTRPDRYESMSKGNKERGKHTHQRSKDESKIPKGKPRRKHGEKPGNSIGQAFHANNVAGDRLTLKPRGQLGLFNKGKASTAIKGRGLPDLVFTEMKFLQKNEEQPAVECLPLGSKDQRRIDAGHEKDDRISAFFTSARPPLKEKDGNIQAKIGGLRNLESSCRVKDQSSMAEIPIRTVEGSDRMSCLESGSRGPRRESTGYVSWSPSESAQSPISVSLQQAQGKPALTKEQREPHKQGIKLDDTKDQDTAANGPDLSTAKKRKTGNTCERFAVSSSEPSHGKVSRSQSYPLRSSSPRKLESVKGNSRRQSAKPLSSPTYLLPDIDDGVSANPPTICPRGNKQYTGSNIHMRAEHHIENCDVAVDGTFEQVNARSQTSCAWEQGLQQCDGTVLQRPRQDFTHKRDTPLPRASSLYTRGNFSVKVQPAMHRVPTVRFSDVPNFAGSSIYQQQAQQCQLGPRMEEEGDGAEDELYTSCVMGQEDGNEGYASLYDEYDKELIRDQPTPTWNGASMEDENGIDEVYGYEAPLPHVACRKKVRGSEFWRPNKLY